MQTWLESWYLNCRPRVSVFELQTWGLTIGPPGLENPGFKYPLCNFLLSSCSVINWAIIDWCVNAMAVGLNFWKHIFYGNLVLPPTVPDFTFPICCCCWPSQTQVWGNICILSPKVSLQARWTILKIQQISFFLLALWPPHREIFYHWVLSNSYLYHNLRQFANLGCLGWHYHHRHYQHGWRGVACWSWWPSSYWYLLITIVNMILWDVECSCWWFSSSYWSSALSTWLAVCQVDAKLSICSPLSIFAITRIFAMVLSCHELAGWRDHVNQVEVQEDGR